MRASIQQTVSILNDGGIVAVPTETVYGLAARLDRENAIKNLFQIKGRPSNNPLIIHLADASQITLFTKDLPDQFDLLTKTFWPGAMTLVVPVDTSTILNPVRADLPTAAFRIPKHPLALEVIRQSGPLVMPSANISGRPSSTTPEHVESDFGSEFPVLDGGKCENGLESTILIYQAPLWKIIRLGALSAENFIPVLGYAPAFISHHAESTPLCPGQLYQHYSPKAKLLLSKTFPENKQGVIIGFSDKDYSKNYRVIPFGPRSSPKQVARNLYASLRKLDEEFIEMAYVDIDFPSEGLWRTILERLKKAAFVNTP